MSETKLQEELKRSELALNRVERRMQLLTLVTGLFGVLGTVVSVYLSLSQRRLNDLQASEAREKQRVSYNFRLSPIALPGNRLYLRGKLRNLSSRDLTVLMVGIRIWRGDGWDDSVSIKKNPERVLMADNLVADCPPLKKSENREPSNNNSGEWCTPDRAIGKLRLREFDDVITLEPTEGDSEASFGPYPISNEDLDAGFWVEGRAYVAETERGTCVIDETQPLTLGALPHLCEDTLTEGRKCGSEARCSVALAPASFYTKRELARLLEIGQGKINEIH